MSAEMEPACVFIVKGKEGSLAEREVEKARKWIKEIKEAAENGE